MWRCLGLHVQEPSEPLICSVCFKGELSLALRPDVGDVHIYAFPQRDREMIQSALGGKK